MYCVIMIVLIKYVDDKLKYTGKNLIIFHTVSYADTADRVIVIPSHEMRMEKDRSLVSWQATRGVRNQWSLKQTSVGANVM